MYWETVPCVDTLMQIRGETIASRAIVSLRDLGSPDLRIGAARIALARARDARYPSRGCISIPHGLSLATNTSMSPALVSGGVPSVIVPLK